MKATKVEAFLQSGVELKKLSTYELRLSRLRDVDYVLSPLHQAQLWRVARMEVDADVMAFVHHFVKVGAQHGIPVYCAGIDGRTVMMLHAQYEDRLDDDSWVIIGQLAAEVVEDLLIRCDRHPTNPALWTVGFATRRREPSRPYMNGAEK